jgi:starch phosphorylase
LAAWQERVRAAWKEVGVRGVRADTVTPLPAGEARPVQADVVLGKLRPEDVSVTLYAGPLTGQGNIASPRISEMKAAGPSRDGVYVFEGQLSGQAAGRHAFRIRILPAHEDLATPLALNCITWG